METPQTIDSYIAQFSEEQQVRLQEIRQVIKTAAPEATERISWQMPTFFLKGNLVHFAQQKNHLGFYPGANGVEYYLEHKERLGEYKHSKGAIQFPSGKPLPHELITEIVTFRVGENTGGTAH
ncbi:MAG: DUF1801 domain-containing protein [Lachnospiraceae bacterium]|jgi:uncharacterized protein YdhG (YjbR/CyaY superfamily)|nr:DUF1801 domain-containing protein [Lachnospiraceae bacterium]